jgi:hypothetical protein
MLSKIFGRSSLLWLVINSYHDSSYATVYEFTKKDFETDNDLKAIIFERTNSFGVFKGTKQVANVLCNVYAQKHAIDFFPIADLENYCAENDFSNLGVACEYYLIDRLGGKHGSTKMDKNNMVDLHINGHYIQLKCSLCTEKTDKSYSTTNCK